MKRSPFGKPVSRIAPIFMRGNLRASVRVTDAHQKTAKYSSSWPSICIVLNGAYYVKTSVVRGASKGLPSSRVPSVYLGKLPKDIREKDLQGKLGELGLDPVHISLKNCENRRLVNLAFVDFKSLDAANAAVKKLNGLKWLGSNLKSNLQCHNWAEISLNGRQGETQLACGRLQPSNSFQIFPFTPALQAAGSIQSLSSSYTTATADLLLEFQPPEDGKGQTAPMVERVHWSTRKNRSTDERVCMKKNLEDLSFQLSIEQDCAREGKSNFRADQSRKIFEMYVERLQKTLQRRPTSEIWPRDTKLVRQTAEALGKWIKLGGKLDRSSRVDVQKNGEKVVMWRYHLVEKNPVSTARNGAKRTGAIIRLHLFPQASETYIHNHKTNFISFLMGGEYFHHIWQVDESKPGNVFRYPRGRGGEQGDEEKLKGQIGHVCSHVHRVSQAYFLNNRIFHTVSVEKNTGSTKPEHAKVLSLFVKDRRVNSGTSILQKSTLNTTGSETELVGAEKEAKLLEFEKLIAEFGELAGSVST